MDAAPSLRSLGQPTVQLQPLGVQDEDCREAIKRLIPEGFDKMPESFSELSPSYRVANPDGVERWSAFESRSLAPQGARGAAQPTKNRVTLALIEEIKIPTLVIAAGANLYAPPVLAAKVSFGSLY